MLSENQFNKKATSDAFDEIYTNFDVASISDEYRADSGYPFSFPIRWLNDPSMNKRIAIRRLDVIPSSHSFTLELNADPAVGPDTDEPWSAGKTAKIDITEHDNLIKAMSYICDSLSTYDDDRQYFKCRLMYEYDEKLNRLKLFVRNYDEEKKGMLMRFNIRGSFDSDLKEFLEFLNQPTDEESLEALKDYTYEMVFDNVWSRDRLYVHSSFSTSHRKYIGKRGDFYQNMNLLYPLPSNESVFHVFFTSDGKKTILIRYCNFDIQLCFIVNYKKSVVL